MNPNPTSEFYNPDIATYLKYNGYESLPESQVPQPGMIFTRNNEGVHFFKNCIEKRTADNLGKFQLTSSFTGFNPKGHLNEFIMLFDVMGIVKIDEAIKKGQSEGLVSEKIITKLGTPLSENLTER